MKNPIHLSIIFIILIFSDLFIGFYSHYMGATDADFSAEAFFEYLIETDPIHWIVVFAVAIGVCLAVFFLGGG